MNNTKEGSSNRVFLNKKGAYRATRATNPISESECILEPIPRIPVRFKRDAPAFHDHSGKSWREGELQAGSRVALPEPEAARFIMEGIANYSPFKEVKNG